MDFEISMLSGDKIAEELAAIQVGYPLSVREQADHTIQYVLSSLRQLQLDNDLALSSIPIHPYERMKWEYLDPNTPPITLDDVRLPVGFCQMAAYESLSALGKKVSDNTLTAIASITGDPLADINAVNAFATLSGGAFVVDKEMANNHLQFLEFAKSISLDQINNNPIETAQKVVYQFLRSYEKY